MSKLQGLHVLVTRPSPAGEELCQHIIQAGGMATHFPTIVFGPPKDQQAFEQAVLKLGEQDWLIFISPHAVQASVPYIRKAWPHFPEQVKWAAVGAGTANALKDAGYIVAAIPSNEWSSEGLLAMPEFKAVSGLKIALIRGEGGRELLQHSLQERGAHLLPVVAYQRLLPKLVTTAYQDLISNEQCNVIVCTSFEGVQNLKTLLGEALWPKVKEVPLIVMSDRIKLLAQDLGFQTIWVTRQASHESILDFLALKRNELCHLKQIKF